VTTDTVRSSSSARRCCRISVEIDSDRLVALAVDLVSISSPTGDEQAMGERVRDELAGMGLQVQWQEVEEGRPNVVGILEGAGGGKSLMFNGHMDTSYSGREQWLAGIRGFQPEGFVHDGKIYGLGISNMKGALACYIEAVRALQGAGVRLRGDVMIACVAGEIEKTQWSPDYVGKEYRGYAAGSRHLAAHGAVTDMCILGEPTEQKIVLGHYGAIWMRISTSGPFIHTAFSEGRRDETSIVRMRDVLDAVLEFAPEWEERTSYGASRGASRGPRTAPTCSSISAFRRRCRWSRPARRSAISCAGFGNGSRTTASSPRST
jgi:acetylornithine deacetylase/succinyl-diaminopimelate desuccinylase-like protein